MDFITKHAKDIIHNTVAKLGTKVGRDDLAEEIAIMLRMFYK